MADDNKKSNSNPADDKVGEQPEQKPVSLANSILESLNLNAPKTDDRRAHQRYNFTYSVVLHNQKSQVTKGTLVDFSLAGMAVLVERSNFDLKMFQPYMIEFSSSGEFFKGMTLPAELRNISDPGNNKVRLGFRMKNLTKSQERKLNEYIEEAKKSSIKK